MCFAPFPPKSDATSSFFFLLGVPFARRVPCMRLSRGHIAGHNVRSTSGQRQVNIHTHNP